MLSEKQPIFVRTHLNYKKETQGSQVFEREFLPKFLYNAYNQMRVIASDN